MISHLGVCVGGKTCCGHVFCDIHPIACSSLVHLVQNGYSTNLQTTAFISPKFRLEKTTTFGHLPGDTYTLDLGLI